FKGNDSILFMAGKVHQKETKDNIKEYGEINYKLAIEVAKKAKNSHVKHFIYMSTAAVYGIAGEDRGNVRIEENSHCIPKKANGMSKRKAEIKLLEIERRADVRMNVCIVRPPIVYGNNCPRNFTKL